MTTPIIEKKQSIATALNSAAATKCRQYSEFLEEWQDLNLPGELPAFNQIRPMCRNLEASVREWIYQNTPTLKALPLNKAEVLKMIEVPDLRPIEQIAWDVYNAAPSVDVPERFFVIEGTKVSVTAAFKDFVDTQSTTVISGRKAEAQRRAEELLAQLNAFAKDFPQIPLFTYQSGETYYMFMQDGPGKPVTFSKSPLSKVR